jgi:hypothetical protein
MPISTCTVRQFYVAVLDRRRYKRCPTCKQQLQITDRLFSLQEPLCMDYIALCTFCDNCYGECIYEVLSAYSLENDIKVLVAMKEDIPKPTWMHSIIMHHLSVR